MLSRKGHTGQDQLNGVAGRAKVDARMVGISLRRRHDVQLKLLRAVVLAEPQFAVLGVELDIDDVVDSEGEGLECGVELLDRVRPGVAVGGDEVAAVADVGVVEMVVRCFYAVFEADSRAHPTHELLHLYAPAGLAVYVKG